MYAIEFKTNITNGIITIPKEYQEFDDNQPIRVIILKEKKKREPSLGELQTSSMFKTWDNSDDEACDEL